MSYTGGGSSQGYSSAYAYGGSANNVPSGGAADALAAVSGADSGYAFAQSQSEDGCGGVT
jgi:hypothetical protein